MIIIQFILFFLPLLTLAQDSSSSSSSSQSAPSSASGSNSGSQSSNAPTSTQFTTILSTFVSTSVGFVSGSRQETTVVISSVLSTVVPVPTGSNGDNNTPTPSSTSTVSLPPKSTAPSVDGGGYNGGSGAPLPGAKSPNNAFGPDDNYIAAATTLTRNAFAATLIASLVAAVVLVL
ncbi:hypothetical protein CVT24_011597 [Panaeolus cyanescens]|uniref:REJ domain-containing protein n=1 Tax=Panaeolus cyanescens TaxID=181874 RepID=A0A409YV46_9AGAR|nr:hypothetical protein CVT24_011597 [Panaeolus cyanescens]